jgi:hypothetical protein
MEAGIPRGGVNATFLDIRFVHNAVANAELEYYSLLEAEGTFPNPGAGMMLRGERFAGISGGFDGRVVSLLL